MHRLQEICSCGGYRHAGRKLEGARKPECYHRFFVKFAIRKPPIRWLSCGAEGETRTRTGVHPLDPEPSASTSSATSAHAKTLSIWLGEKKIDFTPKLFYINQFRSAVKNHLEQCVSNMKMSPLIAMLKCPHYEKGHFKNESAGEAQVPSFEDGVG